LKIAFAITSRNYLAQTKIAVGLFVSFHPDFKVFVFNIDSNSYKTEGIWDSTSIVHYFVHDIIFENKEELRSKYNDFEFCNAIKPFLCYWLFEEFKDAEHIVYLDSDLAFYNTIELEKELKKYSAIITPHSLSEFPNDNMLTSELDINNSGLYNAGFFIITNSEVGKKILNWWKKRTFEYCYIDFEKGMLHDQIWLNFFPLYFENVLILKNPGYNVAHWNLHERFLSFKDNIFVNDQYKLVFFHFSGFAFDEVNKISKHQNRFTLDSRNDLSKIFVDYKKNVEEANNTINHLLGAPSKSQRRLKKLSTKIQKWKGKVNKIVKILVN
jgi:hypothetical protein